MDEELIGMTTEDVVELEIGEVVENEVNAEDLEQNIATEETVETVEVETEEEIEIVIEESVGWVGGDSTRHYSLTNRDEADSHPIKAITGLREELDKIEALQTVYSDKKQQADYYLWHDENKLLENRDGLFVSFSPETTNIIICNGTNDVFGVTVAEAGFIGGQEYVQANDGTKIGRDRKYGLVVHSGLVGVRRETTVAVGDYVVPNSRGEAQKSDGNYGYLVTALSEVNGIQYAIISLSASSTLSKNMAGTVQDLSGRMTTAEYNITSVTNVANSAYVLAKDAKENAEVNSEYIEEKITEVLGRMDQIDGENGIVDNLSQSVNNACESAALAKTIAEGAVSSAEAIRSEAVEAANAALSEATNTRKDFEATAETLNNDIQIIKDEIGEIEGGLNDFKEEVTDTYVTRTDFTAFQTENTEAIAAVQKEASETYATITSVTSLETSTSEAISGLRQEVSETYATNTSLTQLKTDTTNAIAASEEKATETYATKTELTSFQGETNKSMAQLQQKTDANGAKIEALVANIDIYSVGEYSQAYGLSFEQAKNILSVDTIYVPTIVHSETYDEYTQEFLLGYYYTWNGEEWTPSQSTAVSFSSEYFGGTEQTPYWVVTVADVIKDEITYDLGGLYLWESDAWVKVASVADNTLSRAVSAIKQTTTSISAEVSNVKGDVSGLTARVGANETSLRTVTTWKSTVEEDVSKIATIEQKTNDNTSSIALVVSETEGEKVVNTASIVTAVNDSDSAITLNANKINFVSQAFSIYPSDGQGNQLSSVANFTVDSYGNVGIAGTVCADRGVIGNITIKEGAITSQNGNFSVDAEGNLTAKGNGNIGGYQITDTSLTSGNVGMSSDKAEGAYAFWAGNSVPSKAPFNVTNGGKIIATEADISGKITATSGEIGGCSIKDGTLNIQNAKADGIEASNVKLYGSFTSGQTTGTDEEISYNQIANGLFYSQRGNLENGVSLLIGSKYNGAYYNSIQATGDLFIDISDGNWRIGNASSHYISVNSGGGYFNGTWWGYNLMMDNGNTLQTEITNITTRLDSLGFKPGTITLSVSNVTANTKTLTKQGKYAIINLDLTKTTTDTGFSAGTVIGTLPTEFAATGTQYCTAYGNTGATGRGTYNWCQWKIKISGTTISIDSVAHSESGTAPSAGKNANFVLLGAGYQLA